MSLVSLPVISTENETQKSAFHCECKCVMLTRKRYSAANTSFNRLSLEPLKDSVATLICGHLTRFNAASKSLHKRTKQNCIYVSVSYHTKNSIIGTYFANFSCRLLNQCTAILFAYEIKFGAFTLVKRPMMLLP